MLKVIENSNISQNRISEYVHRINRVIDYIEDNIGKDLSVEELSGVANFSSFHFQRIFASIVGEPLGKFVQRLSIEKAAAMLIRDPSLPVTEVALSCGFSSSATFARAFRDNYQMSASEWRNSMLKMENSTTGKKESTKCKTLSNIGKEFEISSIYISNVPFKQIWRIKMLKNSELQTEVRVEEIPQMHLAYVRNIGPYKGDAELFEKLINKLCTWAGPRGLLRFPETKMLTIYHDNPEITSEDKQRISVCITVPEGTPVEGEIGMMAIPAGKYAVARFEISSHQFQDAWNAVYAGWLPQSGYQPDDGPCYELCLNDPNEHPEHKHIVEIHIPVKPL